MKTALVIPARYNSSRFQGKPLAKLSLPDGKETSLIAMTYRAAEKIPDMDAVLVATDDERIFDHVKEFGGNVRMTSTECRNGTERVAEIAESLSEFDVFIDDVARAGEKGPRT